MDRFVGQGDLERQSLLRRVQGETMRPKDFGERPRSSNPMKVEKESTCQVGMEKLWKTEALT